MFVLYALRAAALNLRALFRQRRGSLDVVAIALKVAVQIVDVRGDHLALGIVPGACADAATRIHAWPALLSLCAQIRVPRAITRTGRGGLVLANLIGAGEPAQITRAARIRCDEKTHRL